MVTFQLVTLSMFCYLKGEDPTLGNPNFWDEFFLLKPKMSYLLSQFEKLNDDQLLKLKV